MESKEARKMLYKAQVDKLFKFYEIVKKKKESHYSKFYRKFANQINEIKQ